MFLAKDYVVLSLMLVITLRSFIGQDAHEVFQRVSEIIKHDFPQLLNIYNEIMIMVAGKDAVEDGSVQRAIDDFFGRKTITYWGNTFYLRSCSIPPLGCLAINTSIFMKFDDFWQKDFSVRHECFHLLLREKQSNALTKLLEKYELDYLKHFVRFQHEYLVHLNMIRRWPQDSLKEPVGYVDNLPDPAFECSEERKKWGKKAAMEFEVQNMVHLLSLLDRYGNIPDRIQASRRREEGCSRTISSIVLQRTDERLQTLS